MVDPLNMLENLLEQVAAAQKPSLLRQVAFGYFSGLRATHISYHHLPPPGAKDRGKLLLETEGYPKDLVQRYIDERMFLVDPIAVYAQKSTQPFRWSEISNLTNLSADQKAYLVDLYDLEMADGYAFPVFGPGGRNGVFSLAYIHVMGELAAHAIREIHWVCQSLHLRYCELLEQRIPEITGLSRREREVLEWVALGKSNADIATIMGVSAHTVDAYLRRVFLKLGTTDRVTAAMRAAGSGILTGVV